MAKPLWGLYGYRPGKRTKLRGGPGINAAKAARRGSLRVPCEEVRAALARREFPREADLGRRPGPLRQGRDGGAEDGLLMTVVLEQVRDRRMAVGQ